MPTSAGTGKKQGGLTTKVKQQKEVFTDRLQVDKRISGILTPLRQDFYISLDASQHAVKLKQPHTCIPAFVNPQVMQY